MTEETIILMDSPEAAKLEMREVWVSSNGHVTLDERVARYAGATHVKCSTDATHPPYQKNSYCKQCHSARRAALFESFPKQEWDGEAPLNLFDGDRYFFDSDDLLSFCEESECQPQDLQLVLCVPNNPRYVESDYWHDQLPEEGEIPDALFNALNTLNDVIKACGPLSYSGGQIAVIIPDDLRVELEALDDGQVGA